MRGKREPRRNIKAMWVFLSIFFPTDQLGVKPTPEAVKFKKKNLMCLYKKKIGGL